MAQRSASVGRVGLRVLVWTCALLLCCASIAAPQSTSEADARPGTLSGVVTDEAGTAIAGATVTWSSPEGSSSAKRVTTAMNGQFSLASVASGAYRLAIASAGFAAQVVSGVLPAGTNSQLPPIRLRVAFGALSVNVTPTVAEIAQRQIQQQEQQRVLGVVPNYYVTYTRDAAPLNARQKFELFEKSILDPVDFAFTGFIAGVQHARNDYPGFGRGMAGFGKRYAAFYASVFTRSAIDAALLPSLLRQDPRYFYKGTGSTPSRIGYAMATAVVRRGDNRRWEPNYSGIVGSLAAGALTNLYYPSQDRRGIRLTLENSGIALATSAASHLAQEFLFNKVTTRGRPVGQPRP